MFALPALCFSGPTSVFVFGRVSGVIRLDILSSADFFANSPLEMLMTKHLAALSEEQQRQLQPWLRLFLTTDFGGLVGPPITPGQNAA